MQWQWKSFFDLTSIELYDLLRLRQDVFVLEQQCLYADIDGNDEQCFHLLGKADDGRLLAYLRVVPPGLSYPEPSIGRVLTAQDCRGQGAGQALLEAGVRLTRFQYPGQPIRISAQLYLQGFYQMLGFAAVGEPYDEDDIPHIEMLLPA